MLRVKVVEPGKIEYQDVPAPEPSKGEALIAVKSVGLCYSDVAPYQGRFLDILPLPMVQGHEFGGIVESICGKTKAFKAGDKVAVYPMTECGQCYYCKHGMDLLCDNQVMFGSPQKDGGMAEKIAVPLAQLVKLNDDFDIRYAGLIEPATVAYRAVGGFKDSNVVIVGTGAIGMIMTQICKANNNKVIALDKVDDILGIAKRLGADLTLNVKNKSKKEEIDRFLGCEKVDAVVLVFLSQENLNFALDIARKNGTIAYMCMPEKLELDFTPMLFKALKIVSTISYNMDMFKKATALIQSGKIDYRSLVTKMFPLTHAKEAFDYKGSLPSLKILLIN